MTKKFVKIKIKYKKLRKKIINISTIYKSVKEIQKHKVFQLIKFCKR